MCVCVFQRTWSGPYSKDEAINHCCFNVAPVAQHWNSTGSSFRVWWAVKRNHGTGTGPRLAEHQANIGSTAYIRKKNQQGANYRSEWRQVQTSFLRRYLHSVHPLWRVFDKLHPSFHCRNSRRGQCVATCSRVLHPIPWEQRSDWARWRKSCTNFQEVNTKTLQTCMMRSSSEE